MEITIYGYVLIPLLITLSIIRPKYLIYLLIISLTLQITSLFNIGNYSMQIYRFITILISIRFLVYLLTKGMSVKFKDKNLKYISIYGGLFTLFAIIWSYLAPYVFSGYPVYPPELGIDYSAIYGASPLSFSIYNIAFGSYILLYLITLVYINVLSWNKRDIKIIKRVILLCTFIIVLTSASQLFAYFTGFLDVTPYLYTIKTRELNYSLIGYFLPVPRIQATYQEPSMLAPFLIGLYSYMLYELLLKFSLNKLLGVMTILFLIILSASTTAFISIFIMTFILLFYLIKSKHGIASKIGTIIKFLTFTSALLFVVTIFSFITIGIDNVTKIIDTYLINKPQSTSFSKRTTADLHALKLFLDTYGLGVGLGSNRPSSLLPYLLSQLGIIGTSLFILFISKIIIYSYKTLKNTKYFAFFFLIPSVIVAQLVAYPDITNPTLWQFIYIAIITSLAIKNTKERENASLH